MRPERDFNVYWKLSAFVQLDIQQCISLCTLQYFLDLNEHGYFTIHVFSVWWNVYYDIRVANRHSGEEAYFDIQPVIQAFVFPHFSGLVFQVEGVSLPCLCSLPMPVSDWTAGWWTSTNLLQTVLLCTFMCFSYWWPIMFLNIHVLFTILYKHRGFFPLWQQHVCMSMGMTVHNT